ncbi:MAG: hypothetical protein WCH46_08040 [bacterium]
MAFDSSGVLYVIINNAIWQVQYSGSTLAVNAQLPSGVNPIDILQNGGTFYAIGSDGNMYSCAASSMQNGTFSALTTDGSSAGIVSMDIMNMGR